MKRRGFTLVELAIVLVIIGLLVGGLLAAKSMISSAKTQSYIRSFQQYDIGLANFQSNYNQLPGDSNLFIPPGNANGIIDGSASCNAAPNNAYTRNEQINFWAQLKQANMLNIDVIPWSPTNCGGTHSTVSANMGGISFPVFEKNRYWITIRGYASDKVPVFWATTLGSETVNNYNTFANPLTVMAIDAKMDDGTMRHGLIAGDQYYNIDNAPTITYPAYCDEYVTSGGDDDKILCKFWYFSQKTQAFQ